MSREIVITSRNNPTVKKTADLLSKKGRRESGLFRFDGIKLLFEGASAGLTIEYALLSEDASEQIKQRVTALFESLRLPKDKLFVLSESVFANISEEKAPEGIITVARIPTELHRELTPDDARGYDAQGERKLLLAESLRDPGNLGTVVRSCAALGIDRLVISGDCADLYNPKTVRAAMGGLFKLKIDIFEGNSLNEAVLALRRGGRRIYAAALGREALRLGGFPLGEKDAFVIGNEGHGLSEELIAACDGCAVIPMEEGAESLNAAAAAAICIWETVKGGK